MASAALTPASARSALPPPPPIVLQGVSWESYCQIRDVEDNNHVRMSYLDGELTIMSPGIRHDYEKELLGLLARAVASALGLRPMGIGSTTLRRPGGAPKKGAGKEPDTAFYLGAHAEQMRRCEDLDLLVDPPPDLAMEIDHLHNTAAALAIYVRLGVPEVWRFLVPQRQMIFHRLIDGQYHEVERSVALPKLTPTLILAALDHFLANDLDEMEWTDWVRQWVLTLPDA